MGVYGSNSISTNYSSKSDANVNPYTGKAYSSRYFDILAKRQQLPVYDFRDDLIDKVRNNQTIVVEGETGSGTCHFVMLSLKYIPSDPIHYTTLQKW